ncbi:MAG: hypothetical protein AB1659_12440, partial [Thermodesulfobacteriota bacterium]
MKKYLFLFLLSLTAIHGGAVDDSQPGNDVQKIYQARAFGQLPLHFEANRGQFDDGVEYFSRGNGFSLFLTANEAVFAIQPSESNESFKGIPNAKTPFHSPGPPVFLRFQLLDANPQSDVSASDPLPGETNYLIGNDPNRWRAHIPNYAKVHYSGVYPGIDLIYYGNQRKLEYDFVVHPGADPARIRFQFQGANGCAINESGDLVLHTPLGEWVQHKPLLYQLRDGKKQEIQGRYMIYEDHTIGFKVGDYDINRPLIIDPILSFST